MRHSLLILLLSLAPMLLLPAGDASAWTAKRTKFNPAMIARYKGMLLSSPDDSFAFRKLVGMYQTYSSMDRLIGEYKKVLKATPDHYAHNVVLGRIYLKIDRFDEAKRHFEVASKKDPRRFEAFKNLGKLYLRKGKYDLARTNLDLALKNVTKNKRVRERLLRELVRISVLGGDIKGGTRYFELLLKIRPGDFRTRWDFAELLSTGMHFKKALLQYNKLYKMVSGDTRRKVQVMKAKGQLFEKMGKDQEAIKTYWKAMALTASGHWVRRELINRLVSIARRRDELPRLLKEFRRKWGSPSGFQYSMIAKIYSEIGQFDKAATYFKLAIRRDPSNVDYRIEIIALLEKSGASPKEIIREQEALMRAAPSQLKYAVELAARYEKVGKSKKAMALTRRLIRQNPTDASLLLGLADLYAQWNKPDQVIKMYQKLVQLEPGDAEHHINLGQQYWGRGKRDKAMKQWKKILKPGIFPKKEEAYYTFATVLMEVGKYQEALAHLKKALTITPDNTKYMFLHGQLLIKLRRLNEAARVFEATLVTAEKLHNVLMSKKVRKRLLNLWQELRILSRELKKRRAVWRPSKIDMGMFLAEGYTLLGKWAEAEKIFRKMRKRRPALSEPLLGLIRLYESLGKYQGLIALLHEALKLIPHRAQEFLESLSSTWAVLGNDKKARHYLSLAIQKGAKDSKAWAKAGELGIKLEDYAGAIKAYQEAIRLDPYEMEYYFALASLYLQTSKPKEATRVYHRIINRASEDELVEKAARYSMDIDELSGDLGTLERVIYPLSFAYSHRPIFSKLLLEVYKRYVPALAYIKNNATSKVAIARANRELKRLSTRALKPLLEALTSDSLQEMNEARTLLAALGNPNSAVPLIRMAKRLWEKGLMRLKKHPEKDKFLSEGEFTFVRRSIFVAATIGDKSIYKELKYFAGQSRDVGVAFLGMWGISKIIPGSKEIRASLYSAKSVAQIKLSCFTLGGDRRMQRSIKAFISDKGTRLDLRIACLKALVYRASSNQNTFVRDLYEGGTRYDMRHAAAMLLPLTPAAKDVSELVWAYLTADLAHKRLYAQGALIASGARSFSELRSMAHPGLTLGGTAYDASWASKYLSREKLRSILYPSEKLARGKNVTLWMPSNVYYSSHAKKPSTSAPRIIITAPELSEGECRNSSALTEALQRATLRALKGTTKEVMNVLSIFNRDLSLKGLHGLCSRNRARALGKALFNGTYPHLKGFYSSPSSVIRERLWTLAILTGKRSLAQFLRTVTWKDSRARVLGELVLAGFGELESSFDTLLALTTTDAEKLAVLKIATRTKGAKARRVITRILANQDAVTVSIGLELIAKRPFEPALVGKALHHPSITVARLAYSILKTRAPKSLTQMITKLPSGRRAKLTVPDTAPPSSSK